MIRKLEFRNIQGHKDTTVLLSSRVNVFRGTSHHGKSSLTRGFRWAVLNQGKIKNLKSRFAKPSDPSLVRITFQDGTFVERKRSSSANCYTTPVDTYAAIRNEVPSEVHTFLQMGEINIQGQYSKFHLLESSPGEVMRQLNETVGMDIVEKLFSAIRIVKSSLQSKIKYTKQNLQEYEKEIENTKGILSLRKKLEEVEQAEVRIKELKSKKERLAQILEQMSKVQRHITFLEKITNLSESIDEIIEGSEQINFKKGEAQELDSSLRRMTKLNQDIQYLENQVKTGEATLDSMEVCPLCGKPK